MIGGIVLAAGAGRRFGGPKQLALLDGRPMLEHAIRAMVAAPVGRVVVVLGSESDLVLSSVDLDRADPIVCERWEEGQSASLSTGLTHLRDCEAVVVTLGDQPGMTTAAIRRVIAARSPDAPAARATYDGKPGHPVLLEHRLFDRLRAESGDHGARSLLRQVRVREVPCDDLGGGEDVDTIAQLNALDAGDGAGNG